MSQKPPPKPPRVICDDCPSGELREASVEQHLADHNGNWYGTAKISCHDRVELIPWRCINLKPKYLWSELQELFEPPHSLQDAEQKELDGLLGAVDKLILLHEVRRAQGAAPTIVDHQRIDRAVDTLLLFRKEES